MVCIYNAAPGIKITYCVDYVERLFEMKELNSQRRKAGRIVATTAAVPFLVVLPFLDGTVLAINLVQAFVANGALELIERNFGPAQGVTERFGEFGPDFIDALGIGRMV